MKTVKPLLTIGAAFLINTITQYIVDASSQSADQVTKTNVAELELSAKEVEALKKIGLDDAATLKSALNINNVDDVEKALNELDGSNEKWNALIKLLDAAVDVTVAVKDGAKLETADKDLIKQAVGKVVKALREDVKAWLKKIDLTPENLKKALTKKENIVAVELALQTLKTSDDWKKMTDALNKGQNAASIELKLNQLIDALNKGLKAAGIKELNQDAFENTNDIDKIFIVEIIDKEVTAVAWKKVDLSNNQLKKIAAIDKITAQQLVGLNWTAAVKVAEAKGMAKNVTAHTLALNLTRMEVQVKVKEWVAIQLTKDQLKEMAVLKEEDFDKILNEGKHLLAVTGTAIGASFSSAVMLAPVVAWFLF